MNKIISSLLKSNFFILGIGLAFIVLAQSEINIPLQFEYMIAKSSMCFVIADSCKIISKTLQDNEVNNYRYNFLCNLEDNDVSEFICLTDFKNRKLTDRTVGILNYCNIILIIIGFASIILLPLQEYDTIITDDIKNYTLVAFAFVFFNNFLTGLSDNLSGYYHETFKSRYLRQSSILIADYAADVANETMSQLKTMVATANRSLEVNERLLNMIESQMPLNTSTNEEPIKEEIISE